MTPEAASTRRRTRRTGLLYCDPEQACPGYVAFAPMYSAGELLVVGLDGEVAARWPLPYPPGLWAYPLPNGNLFLNGRSPDPDPDRFMGWSLIRGGVLAEVTRDGAIVWEHRDPDHHHDGRRTPSGGAIYLASEPLPKDLVQRVSGGIPGTDAHGMWGDVVIEVDAAGERIWQWRAAEHLDPIIDRLTFNDGRHEWSHANTVAAIDDSRVLLSCRNLSTILVIDKRTGAILHRIGPPTLAQQHDASWLPNGNVLVFDNGPHRHDMAVPFSRVLEIDPTTGGIVWSYQDNPVIDFFSPFVSGARRLPNGNTLITEGTTGRIFQVTPQGDVVWEYLSPHEGHASRRPFVLGANAIFRSSFLTEDDL